jgi:CRP/FNR family cyclic AMP-dependent transcriptional regulator
LEKTMGAADFITEYKGFKAFDANDIAAINAACSEEKYSKDEAVFQEEAPGDRMYIIKSGSVRIVKRMKDKENTLAVLNPGEFFGEMALLDGMPRSAGAKAADGVVLISISRANYSALREKAPVTALRLTDILVSVLSTRLRQANRNLEAISLLIE